jgi:hypothetical protein
MKINILLAFFLSPFAGTAHAQIQLEEGVYTSADGYYSFQMKFVPDGIQVIEPDRSNIYRLSSDGLYRHSEQQYANFYIRVISSKELRTGNGKSPESYFKWTSQLNEGELESSSLDDNCSII